MFVPQNEFMKYATKHLGMGSMHLEKIHSTRRPVFAPTFQGFTTAIIDERIKNVFPMDVFSRLMMDRIIFWGYRQRFVANVIQAQLLFLESDDPKRDVQMFINSPGGSVIAGMGIYDTMQYVARCQYHLHQFSRLYGRRPAHRRTKGKAHLPLSIAGS